MSSPSLISTPPSTSLTPRLCHVTTITVASSSSSFPATSLRRRSISLPTRASEPVSAAAVAVLSTEEAEAAAAEEKIGARVRVTAALKVYHVPKVAEIDLEGREGTLKQYVAVWKGKRISANLPFKVQFFADVEGRGEVKFFAHLKEDEFEYID